MCPENLLGDGSWCGVLQADSAGPAHPDPCHHRPGRLEGQVHRQAGVQHPQARAGHCLQPDHLLDGALLRPPTQFDHLDQATLFVLHSSLLFEKLVPTIQDFL